MHITIMSVNTLYGGRTTADGSPDDRWPGLAATIIRIDPTVLLLQEANGWLADPRLHAAAEHDLAGMRGLVAPAPSGAHTVVMYRASALRWMQWETKYAGQTHHGFGVAVFEVPGLDVPLTVICAHLTPFSAQAAAQEAQLLTARIYRYGGLGLIGGDINHVPLGDPEPAWDGVPLYNLSSRTLPSAHGEPIKGNTIVGQVLKQGGLTDVAAHMATTGADESLRAPTGRGEVRVDQFHVTANLVPALTGYQRIDTGPYSDHDAIMCTLDTGHIHAARALEWT